MKKIVVFLAITALCSQISACNQPSNSLKSEEITEDIIDTTMDNEPSPILLTEPQRTFVADNNAFTLKFIKTVNDEDKSDKSFIYSPLSITYVLSMVNAAAEGATERELEQTLGFHQGGIQAVNEFCKTLIDNLPKVDRQVQLNIANAIFVNKGYRLLKPYQKDMQKYYDALAESLDFASEKSLNHINGWCNKKTKGMIPSILSELNPTAVAYLLNAIYFKANWAEQFEESLTKNDTFTTAEGPVILPLMRQTHKFRYMKNDLFAAVDLPYGNGQWSMTVMLPEKGKSADDVIDYLAKNGTSFTDDMRRCKVNLKLPRFETESSTNDLIGTMKKMGINRVFGSGAEIPNMCGGGVYISMMLQKARIKVNETGSEAAAVTVVMLEKSCAPIREETVVFHADHPFVYAIREASTGVILFVGKFTGK